MHLRNMPALSYWFEGEEDEVDDDIDTGNNHNSFQNGKIVFVANNLFGA